ncbi:hypothetical protein [Burkholderia cepacia]|uniref:hypothetical protein n=1 Tax=Burkholderia cepacia TaxID=292 RepID=UPI0015895FEA|nr:hypothetical protein [Burkholderia cepacia]
MKTLIEQFKNAYEDCNFDELKKLIFINQNFMFDNKYVLYKVMNINDYFLFHLNTILDCRNKAFNQFKKDLNNSTGVFLDEDYSKHIEEIKEYLHYTNRESIKFFEN